MRGFIHFGLLILATLGGMQAAGFVLNALNIEQAPGLGLDDFVGATVIALGSTLAMSLARALVR